MECLIRYGIINMLMTEINTFHIRTYIQALESVCLIWGINWEIFTFCDQTCLKYDDSLVSLVIDKRLANRLRLYFGKSQPHQTKV